VPTKFAPKTTLGIVATKVLTAKLGSRISRWSGQMRGKSGAVPRRGRVVEMSIIALKVFGIGKQAGTRRRRDGVASTRARLARLPRRWSHTIATT
jgi:hypothetical protein